MSGTQQQPNSYLQNLAMFGSAGQPQMSPYQVGMTALNMANNGGLFAMPQGLHPNTVALLQAIFGQPNMMGSQAPAVQNPYPNGAPNVPKPAAPATAAAPVTPVSNLVSAGVQPTWTGQHWVMPTGTVVDPGSANGPQFVNGNWQWADGSPAVFGPKDPGSGGQEGGQ